MFATWDAVGFCVFMNVPGVSLPQELKVKIKAIGIRHLGPRRIQMVNQR